VSEGKETQIHSHPSLKHPKNHPTSPEAPLTFTILLGIFFRLLLPLHVTVLFDVNVDMLMPLPLKRFYGPRNVGCFYEWGILGLKATAG